MSSSARQPLGAWRNEACAFLITVPGVDLTGKAMRLQARGGAGVPGPALIDLATVTNGNAQGLRLVSVSMVGGVPTSTVQLRINKSTLQGLPYAGEFGDPLELAYAFQIDGVTRMYGSFFVLDSPVDSDAAPSNRQESFGQRAAAVPTDGVVLTITDTGVTVVIGGADLVAGIAAGAADARTQAMAAAAASAGARDAAGAERLAAQRARDLAQLAALTAPNVASSEAAGRNGVADGATFWVDGGAGGLLLYRRTSASASALLGNIYNAAQLAGVGGAGLLGYKAPGAQYGVNPVPRTVESWLREKPVSITDYHDAAADGNDYSPALVRAIAFYDNSRVQPPNNPGGLSLNVGTGVVCLPRGNFSQASRVGFISTQGAGLIGHGQYTSNLLWSSQDPLKTGLFVQGYVGFRINDLQIANITGVGPVADSYGLEFDPTGGGGELQIKRVTFDNWDVGVKIDGDGNNPGNGDKTLIESCSFYCNIAWSNSNNKQAIGHTLLNVNGGGNYMLRYGGAGPVKVANSVYNATKALVLLPESAGGEIAGYIEFDGGKGEYHGVQERRILDASQCLLNAEAGGARVVLALNNYVLDGGPSVPLPTSRAIIKVGDGVSGSDGIVVQANGGSWEGNIEIASAIDSPLQRRWHFRDMKLCPNPRTVSFQGTGSHPLIEWRNNDGYPDVYRGGQSFVGAMDARKNWHWRSVGKAIINTGVADQQHQFGARYGKDFTIAGLLQGQDQHALYVRLIETLDSDLRIQQFKGPQFDDNNVVGPAVTIPAGSLRGKYAIHREMWNLGDGNVYVRMTLPGTGMSVNGSLVIEYDPYAGV